MFHLINIVLAQLQPEPTGDVFLWVLQMGKTIVEMFQSGQHGPAVAGIIMIIVYFLQSLLKDRLPKSALPWFAVLVGVLTAVSAQLVALAVGAAPMSWVSAILQGAMAGAMSSGLWSLLGKKLLELVSSLMSKIGKPKDPPAAPQA